MIEFKAPRSIRSDTLKNLLKEIEKRILVGVLRATHGNKTEAAKILGLNRVSLYKMLKRYGLTVEARR